MDREGSVFYEINKLLKTNRIRLILFLVIGFAAGCVFSGLLVNKSGSNAIRALDNRYAEQYGRATETIGRLETELDRQRDLNLRLREHNTRARELAFDLADSTGRNVRNLQEAITIIGEIRRKLQILEDFYSNSGSADGVN
jgi:glucose-6-phosphate-specific signal transduction histidine kinase